MTIVVEALASSCKFESATISTETRGVGVNFFGCAINQTRVIHPRRPRGSQSGREKRRDESFQAQTDCPWVSEDGVSKQDTFIQNGS